jgi:hypothetical protein
VLKKVFLSKEYKESGLAWVGTILQLNDAKVGLSPADPLYAEMSLMFSSDSFLLNLTEVLLEFCKPFIDPKGIIVTFSVLKLVAQKVSLINPDFCKLSHRYDFSKLPKLADTLNLPIKEAEIPSGGFNFVSEMFYATYYAIHIGVSRFLLFL